MKLLIGFFKKKKKNFLKLYLAAYLLLFVAVASVVSRDLSTHGKVIRNAGAVPETVFIFVMKVLWPPGIC